MLRRTRSATFLVLSMACTATMAASFRPGGDPAKERVIWQDPFDWYGQWNYDNNQIWQGGPTPPGSPTGSYPSKPPNGGCATVIQTFPGNWEMARAQWLSNDCPVIFGPGGRGADPGDFQANVDPHCNGSGEVVTTRGMFGYNDSTWGQGGSYTSMPQFRRSLAGRIQQIADFRGLGTMNGVNGTDEHPLVVIFYLSDGATAGTNPRDLFDNSYVELTMGDDTAPTDYIWRGIADLPSNTTNPEYCPQGPYPIVCQQVREVNGSVSEDGGDLAYLNANCPPLVPAYDPETNTGKTWRSLAFGFMALLDKDPCGVAEQGVDAHKPTVDHFAVFDGNVWRQLRSSRYAGLGTPPNPTSGLPWPWDPSMTPGNAGTSGDFSFNGGDNRVVMKIITDYLLLYVSNKAGEFGATIPRVYKGPFDTIRWGVGQGCELDSVTYTCKSGGTPYRCLTYSTSFGVGYDRTRMDSMNILDGELQYSDLIHGSCCYRNGPTPPAGSCEITDQAACVNAGGQFNGVGTVCGQFRCCPTQYGDTDNDADVDMDDFAVLQRCLTIGGGATTAACNCLDFESNGTVDLNDATHFATCASGEGVPADPDCRNW